MSKWAGVALALVAAALLLAALLLLPVHRGLLELVGWIRGAGGLGALVYALVYVLATLLFVPGSMLTVGAGFAYGPVWGTLLVSPVSVLAATLAFVLGRSIARGWVARRAAQHPRFAAIDRAIGEDGFKLAFVVVLLLRLSPLFPFNLLNYALGLTRIELRTYVLASFLGMLPGTFLYVYLGSSITSVSELLSGSRPSAGVFGQLLYWVGLAATVVATALITRIARRALNRAIQGAGPLSPSGTRELLP